MVGEGQAQRDAEEKEDDAELGPTTRRFARERIEHLEAFLAHVREEVLDWASYGGVRDPLFELAEKIEVELRDKSHSRPPLPQKPGFCVVCGHNPVDVDAGFDTCQRCLDA